MASFSGASLKESPPILNIFTFCKTFGWTITDCYEQPAKDLVAFSVLLDEIGAQEKKENQKTMSKMKNTGSVRRR